MDFEESIRPSKVLQGQENTGFVPPDYKCGTINRPLEFEMRPPRQSLNSSDLGNATIGELVTAHPTSYTSFLESDRFPKVLQGQEICQYRSLTRNANSNLGGWGKSTLANNFNMHQPTKPNFYMLPSEGLKNTYFSFSGMHETGQNLKSSSRVTNFSSLNIPYNLSSVQTQFIREEARNPKMPTPHKTQERHCVAPAIGNKLMSQMNETLKGTSSDCKLFGFSLTGGTPTSDLQSSGKRSCTKVTHISSNISGI